MHIYMYVCIHTHIDHVCVHACVYVRVCVYRKLQHSQHKSPSNQVRTPK